MKYVEDNEESYDYAQPQVFEVGSEIMFQGVSYVILDVEDAGFITLMDDEGTKVKVPEWELIS